MAEKRDIIRLRKRLTLRFGMEQPARMAFTEDISPEGMFIKTTNICPPGTRIKIDLTAQSGEVLAMEALVMWAKKVPPQMIHLVKKCGMGVKFTRIEAGEEAFARLCGELSNDDRPVLLVRDDLHGDPPLPRTIELAEVYRLPGAEHEFAGVDQYSEGEAKD